LVQRRDESVDGADPPTHTSNLAASIRIIRRLQEVQVQRGAGSRRKSRPAEVIPNKNACAAAFIIESTAPYIK
jgi:hypothetical protein